jgi:hypothetical protein
LEVTLPSFPRPMGAGAKPARPSSFDKKLGAQDLSNVVVDEEFLLAEEYG